MAKAQDGDLVKFHLIGKIDDGTELESTVGGDPIALTLGAGQHHPMIEAALQGMDEGETKTVDIPSDQAFGPRRDELVQTVPRDRIPAHIDLSLGMRLEAEGGPEPLTVTVVGLEDDSVTLDGNHPLAGRGLVFDIQMVEVEPA